MRGLGNFLIVSIDSMELEILGDLIQTTDRDNPEFDDLLATYLGNSSDLQEDNPG